MRKVYSLLLYLSLPAILAFLAWRGIKDRGWLQRWGERFGHWRSVPTSGGIVIHGASFGEINAAAPLVTALLRKRPATALSLTTFTPTGSRRARALFGERVHHGYAPLDLPGAVRRFFDLLQPRLLVIMETEIWPNLLAEARQRGVPVLLANARLSTSSVRGYRRFARVSREALGSLAWVGAQSETDAARLVECGAPPGRTQVIGNLKFDLHVSPTLPTEAAALRSRWGAERPVLTAGSTRPGDEDVLIPAFVRLLDTAKDALLILVPRHPERFSEAARRAEAAGLRVALRSQGEACGPNTDCFIIDAMGELMRYYACADVAFVGGTFAEIGGHNLLEPAALGKPVLFGPHTHNTEAVAKALEDCGGGRRLASGKALQDTVLTWFADAEQRRLAGRAARTLAESGRGALADTLSAIEGQLDRA